MSPWPPPAFTRTITSPLQPQPTKHLPPLLPSPTQKTHYRQLTNAEMADHREKGLCFNCDKKHSCSHRCPTHILLFIVEETDPVGDVDSEFACLALGHNESSISVDNPDQSAQISLHAISVLMDGGVPQFCDAIVPPHDLLTMLYPYFLTPNMSMCDPINTFMLRNLKLSVRFRRCWNPVGFSQATVPSCLQSSF